MNATTNSPEQMGFDAAIKAAKTMTEQFNPFKENSMKAFWWDGGFGEGLDHAAHYGI